MIRTRDGGGRIPVATSSWRRTVVIDWASRDSGSEATTDGGGGKHLQRHRRRRQSTLHPTAYWVRRFRISSPIVMAGSHWFRPRVNQLSTSRRRPRCER